MKTLLALFLLLCVGLRADNVVIGKSVIFTVTADGTKPLSFSWYHNGQLIAGETKDSYVILKFSAADAGDYWCVVTNALGSAKSNLATLAAIPAPPLPAGEPPSNVKLMVTRPD